MDTTERLMIMGMCLQGLLANSSRTSTVKMEAGLMVSRTPEELAAQRQANVREAHQYADMLDPLPETTDAQRIGKITRVAYEAVRAAGVEGTANWLDWEAARTSISDVDLEHVEGVFERVSRWFKDPLGLAETYQDNIIRAVTLACVGGL